MKTATAVVILGGGVAALWAIASTSSKPSPLVVPGVTQDDVNASILKSLADIEAIKRKAAGQ